jgi:uncharacterized protein YndB with AHSA1/START domain
MIATGQMTETNRIEKTVLLRASKARIWRALSDAEDFGTWFGVKLEGPFEVGSTVRGKLTHKGFEEVPFEMRIERMDPEKLFAYRWHPNAKDIAVDYSKEPMTLVEFRLAETAEGTVLTVIESGFDELSPERRALTFVANDKGWTSQMERIRRHVDG